MFSHGGNDSIVLQYATVAIGMDIACMPLLTHTYPVLVPVLVPVTSISASKNITSVTTT